MNTFDSSFRADLHTHTYFSDGSDSPEQLLKSAKELGLCGLAITDHDTVEAYSVALDAAKKIGLPLLSGVEFSTYHKKEPVHILGYGFKLASDLLLAFCQRHQDRRKKRNLAMLDKLKRIGIFIEEEELKMMQEADPALKKRTIGRPHIALALVKKGKVSSIKEAFHKYLGEGKACFDPGEQVTPQETIQVIHAAGGKAIIAHPQLLVRNQVVRELLAMPFDGIEGRYARFPKEEEEKWIKIGKEKGWIITGGSDYHGSIKPQNPLGASWVDKKTFEPLYELFLKNN